MKGKLSELFVKLTDCITHITKAISLCDENIGILIKEVKSLRDDVNKLIENNQKGASK